MSMIFLRYFLRFFIKIQNVLATNLPAAGREPSSRIFGSAKTRGKKPTCLAGRQADGCQTID
jgi:hypothetical protein